ncbi:hypothetical protein RS022_04080 [Candidatus Phytoplasma rubi]|uniref:Uncharacterized protein n=1 Tax=Candidatus Phytoplasma rubi TaxID=399025 RepID=A0ABY7BU26_9MOLU|nr:hypothetical protein RS022_04080 [Candidatus Phytoplasma rubi]
MMKKIKNQSFSIIKKILIFLIVFFNSEIKILILKLFYVKKQF